MIRDHISPDLLAELIAKHLGVVNVSLVWEVEAGVFKGATIIATIETGTMPAVEIDSLSAAVQAAARDLPEGWELQINVEKGAGWVTAGKQNAEQYIDFERGGMTLSEQIAECVKIARAAR
jgi:hypothetical protein